MYLADFEVLAKLGEGSFSQVYRVRRISDTHEYALKVVKFLDLNSKERINALNEIRILASIDHPNIICYKEAFINPADNTLCIVMELAEGGDLLKLIRDHKKSKSRIPEDEIWRIAHQITIGLKGLHDRNILHRDLKTANVFLALDGTVKLGDLNIAKLAENCLAHTQTGTPYYTSPEIWNNRPYCSKCDIWSLGCVVYELAALDTPFKGADMAQLYRRITSGVITDIPHAYSRDLMAFIRTLLKINPDTRPTCDQILHRYFTSMSKSGLRDNASLPMLGTIKLSNNLDYLRARLPGPNYIGHRTSTPPASSKKDTECRSNCEDSAKPGGRNNSARTQTIIRERRVNRFKTAERVILNCHHRPDLK